MATVEKDLVSTFPSVNPATGEEFAKHEGHSSQEAARILDEVAIAQKAWQALTFEQRAVHLRAVAAQLRKEKTELARMMALEMGKPITQGEQEIEKCAGNCEFYADRAAELLADEKLEMGNARVVYQPLGTLLAIMPWNFPFWQVLRIIAPVLMAGNAMVLKHAANVTGCAVLIEEVLIRAGVPANVFRTLKISSRQVADVIRHPTIAAVTITGSEPAGKAVAAASGEALKPVVLELGGSDPFIVLEDADLDLAAKTGAWARAQNCGQSCIAAKRFIVADSVHDAFVEKFVEHLKAFKVGDPLDPSTEIGPVAREDLRDELHDQVVRGVKEGAKVILGGTVPDQAGAFYPPTVLVDVKPGNPVFDEETFGPVAAVIRVKDEKEAVELANKSRFGLGSSVWSKDLDRANRVAAQIESGMVFINSMTRSDSRLPFGGVKASGYGRELWSQGIKSFVNTKTVYVD